MENNALYFTFDTLEVDYARRSSVTVTREVTRSMGRHRYRKEQKQYHFSVAPVFTDSLPRHKYEEREVYSGTDQWLSDNHLNQKYNAHNIQRLVLSHASPE